LPQGRETIIHHGSPQFWRSILLTFAGIVLGFILVEAGTRWLYPKVRGDRDTWERIDRRLDNRDFSLELARGNRLNAANIPSISVLHPYLGFVFDNVPTDTEQIAPISSLGFLGGELPAEPSDESFVIAIGGGSVAAQFFLKGKEHLRAQLEESPYFQGKRIRFENYALPGYKQPQELMALNYLMVLGARFDMWISINGFNEVVLPVVENVPSGVSVVYPRSWHHFDRSTIAPEEIKLRVQLSTLTARRQRLRSGFALVPFRYSRFLRAWWDVADRRLDAKSRDTAISLLNWQRGLQVRDYGPVSADRVSDGRDALLGRSVEIWKNASILMARTCRVNQIKYLQFLQPNQYFEGSKILSEEERELAWSSEGYYPVAKAGYPLLVNAVPAAREDGVDLVDLTMMFREESRTVYYDSCCHINELGNRLLAERIATEIVTRLEHHQD
jgi:hypothetical protein